jgi:hypothetical protein
VVNGFPWEAQYLCGARAETHNGPVVSRQFAGAVTVQELRDLQLNMVRPERL